MAAGRIPDSIRNLVARPSGRDLVSNRPPPVDRQFAVERFTAPAAPDASPMAGTVVHTAGFCDSRCLPYVISGEIGVDGSLTLTKGQIIPSQPFDKGSPKGKMSVNFEGEIKWGPDLKCPHCRSRNSFRCGHCETLVCYTGTLPNVCACCQATLHWGGSSKPITKLGLVKADRPHATPALASPAVKIGPSRLSIK